MTKEQLIDLLGDTAAELNELVRKLRDAQEDMAFEDEAGGFHCHSFRRWGPPLLFFVP